MTPEHAAAVLDLLAFTRAAQDETVSRETLAYFGKQFADQHAHSEAEALAVMSK